MKKILRRIISIAAAVSIGALSSLSMTGCSDFDFNPIGKWKLTSDKTFMDDKLYSEEKIGYLMIDAGEGKDPVPMYMGDLIYTFTKSGTGIITVYNEKNGNSFDAQDFTYEYDDKEVVLYISDDNMRREKMPPAEIRYGIETDKDGNIILKSQDKQDVTDTSGNKHVMNSVKTLEKC